MVLVLLVGTAMGYGLSNMNSVGTMNNLKYGWTTSKEIDFHEQLIGASFNIGAMIGAGTGGKIIQFSRRKALLIACVFGSLGCALTLKFGFYYLIAGRVIYGYVSGVSGVATTSYIADYAPTHLYGTMSPMWNMSLAFGIMIAMCSAVVLPPDTHTEELKATENWRYIYAFPIFVYLMAIIVLLLVIKNDGPRFYI